jgi:hypothetical protein
MNPYDTVTFAAREQLFYAFGASTAAAPPNGMASGIITQSHAAVLGFERRLRPWATLKVSGGPLYVTGQNGGVLSPTARLEIESITPTLATRLLLTHDLVIGASRAGAIVGDLAEAAAIANLGSFTTGVRFGVYRNSDVPSQFSAFGAAGYSGEASIDYRIGREWTIGVAALRDARINDIGGGRQVDRDVVQMRLTWERFRPF